MHQIPLIAVASAAVAITAPALHAQEQVAEDVIPLGFFSFPFGATSSSLLNGVRDLGGLTIVETRISWTVTANAASPFDLNTMTWEAAVPGVEGRRTAFFEPSSFDFDGTEATASIVTDALNGEIIADLIIPDGKKGPGGELSVFSIQFNGPDPFQFSDPFWGELTALRFDVVLVPSPGAAAPLACGALLACSRRRRR